MADSADSCELKSISATGYDIQSLSMQDTHLASYAQKLPSHMRIAPRSALPDAGQLRGSDVRSHPQESMMNQTHGQMDTINELREMNEVGRHVCAWTV